MFLLFDKFPEKLTPEQLAEKIRPPPMAREPKPSLPLTRDTQPAEAKGTHCWWCVHELPGPPLHLPFKYDSMKDVFTTTGEFCSWECMKAYAISLNTARNGEMQSFISMMKMKTLGHYEPTRSAPKRQALKIFGGSLSIEEFRKSSSQSAHVFVPHEHYIYFEEKKATSEPVADIGDLKLKRAKPLKRAESKLESVLGITRKK
jgi:hypothetical protein